MILPNISLYLIHTQLPELSIENDLKSLLGGSLGEDLVQPSYSPFLSSPKDMLIDFRERDREGERENKTLMQERNTNRCPPERAPASTKPAT